MNIFNVNIGARGSLISKILLFGILLFVAYQLAVLSVYGVNTSTFVIVSFLFLILLAYFFWKKALILFILWILLAGAVRKWILPQVSDVVFLFGHAILAGAYIRYFKEKFTERSELFIRHPINTFLAFLVLWGFACAINPQLPNILVGILGLVIHFYFIPLLYVLPYALNDKQQLIRLLKIFVLVSIPIIGLGIVQFFLPPEHILNIYAGEGTDFEVALVGGHARVTSTFSYISGYAVYLGFLVLITVYLLSIRRSSLFFTIILYFVLSFSTLSLLMTGSRGPAAFTIGGAVLYLFISGIFSLNFLRKSYVPLLIGIVFVYLFFNFTPLGKSVTNAFMARASDPEDIIPRIEETYTAPFDFFKYAGVYGFGIGTTYQGATALGHDPGTYVRKIGIKGIEQEPGRIMLEVGLVGFILIYLVRILFVKYFWDLYRKLRDPELRHFALACLLFIFPFALGIPNLVFDHTSSIFYWYTIGFFFVLQKLDKQSEYRKTIG